MDNGISTESRQSIADRLHKVLADLYALFVMTQNFHWNLTGKEFYTHHILLEKQYETLYLFIDEIAERIRALGFYVHASLASFQQKTSLIECSELMVATDSLHHLLAAQEQMVKRGRNVGSEAEEHGDHATVDLIARLLGQVEKFSWMIRASI
jgi:starvation-inducible DNA-binding protein